MIDKEVSSEYLPVLHLIANGISGVSTEGFGFDETLMKRVFSSTDGANKEQFAIKVTALSIPEVNGGLTKELIELFDRYKNKYNIYGEGGVVRFDFNKKEESIRYDYDLTPLFVLIEPKNKEILNQFYEAKKKGLSGWKEKGEYAYPYLATKEGYFSYIKEVYPESPYIPHFDQEVAVTELYRAYEENEVSADEQYKGKKLLVTGIVDNIGKDILDDPYVSLRADYLKGVNCYFSKENIKVLSQLRKGQKVSIMGKCQGFSLMSVVLIDCEVEEK